MRRLNKALALAMCLGVLAVGCAKEKPKDVAPKAEKKINVQVQQVETKKLRPTIEAVGTLLPNEQVVVSAELEGILKSVSADVGNYVARLSPLAHVDETSVRLESQRAQAALRQAQATLQNTRLEYDRKKPLIAEQLVTQQQFDDITARLNITTAELERAQAALDIANERLSKTTVYAPISGYVQEKKVSAGDFVKNGTVLFVLIQSNPVKLRFSVPEAVAGAIKPGLDVLFTVDSYPGEEFAATIRQADPSVDAKSRTLGVEALSKNPSGKLKPGFFSQVRLFTGAERDAVVVPVKAVLYEASTTRVFVVEEEKAVERAITLGQKLGDMVEVTEGLKVGDTIVVVGQQGLSTGVKLNVAR